MKRMRVRPWMTAGFLLLGGFGCSEDDAPPPPPVEAVLFIEPPAFCFAGNVTGKTLTVYNLGSDPLTWDPVHVPPGSTGLDGAITVDPHDFRDLVWSWNPSGTYPILDSLVAETNDPGRRRIAIPLRREDPAGITDTVPPAAPLLAFPGDDAAFTLSGGSVQIALGWSEVDDCSGVRGYRVEIALTPAFAPIVCCLDSLVTTTTAEVIAESGDEGVAYWRVRAVDGAGNQGPPSAPRSWTILAP